MIIIITIISHIYNLKNNIVVAVLLILLECITVFDSVIVLWSLWTNLQWWSVGLYNRTKRVRDIGGNDLQIRHQLSRRLSPPKYQSLIFSLLFFFLKLSSTVVKHLEAHLLMCLFLPNCYLDILSSVFFLFFHFYFILKPLSNLKSLTLPSILTPPCSMSAHCIYHSTQFNNSRGLPPPLVLRSYDFIRRRAVITSPLC